MLVFKKHDILNYYNPPYLTNWMYFLDADVYKLICTSLRALLYLNVWKSIIILLKEFHCFIGLKYFFSPLYAYSEYFCWYQRNISWYLKISATCLFLIPNKDLACGREDVILKSSILQLPKQRPLWEASQDFCLISWYRLKVTSFVEFYLIA